MATKEQYTDAIRRVQNGSGNSNDRHMAEFIANSHNHDLQRAAKEALGK